MKSFLGIFLVSAFLFVSNPLTVKADYFYPVPAWPVGIPVTAEAAISPYQLAIAVQNPYGYPLVCEGRAWATTNFLGSGWLYFSTGVVFPWRVGYAYLLPPYGNIFIGGQAWVFCRAF
ncbi:MAG: hypothetical protein AABZ55_15720 [Bdellovibrionota bacterium]